MTNEELNALRYPAGKFVRPQQYTPETISQYISDIETFPYLMRKLVEFLPDEVLNTAYRPDGWTVRQVVHHCADSHINAFVRHKLTLTEDTPTIKTYLENLWAELPDTLTLPLEPSLKMLEGLHQRWVILLKSLNESDLKKQFFHPDQKRNVSLEENIALYAWHCKHHLAHVRLVKEATGFL